MKFTPTVIDGVFILDLERRGDDRGFFARFHCNDELEALGLTPVGVQGNLSFTASAGTVRGLHWQETPHAEAKLFRCVRGAIFDVALDVRPDSPTFGTHVGVELSSENRRALYVPEGVAHGYQTLTPDAEALYLVSAPYAPGHERGVCPDDPALGIEWPRTITEVSDKDRSWPPFAPTSSGETP